MPARIADLASNRLVQATIANTQQRLADRQVQISTLLSIKTGACPEDCAYCPQSAHYETDVDKQGLLDVDHVVQAARAAKKEGVQRFCMGAAWREIKDGPEFENVLQMVRGVAETGLEVCCTLGMLSESQARQLADAGLQTKAMPFLYQISLATPSISK